MHRSVGYARRRVRASGAEVTSVEAAGASGGWKLAALAALALAAGCRGVVLPDPSEEPLSQSIGVAVDATGTDALGRRRVVSTDRDLAGLGRFLRDRTTASVRDYLPFDRALITRVDADQERFDVRTGEHSRETFAAAGVSTNLTQLQCELLRLRQAADAPSPVPDRVHLGAFFAPALRGIAVPSDACAPWRTDLLASLFVRGTTVRFGSRRLVRRARSCPRPPRRPTATGRHPCSSTTPPSSSGSTVPRSVEPWSASGGRPRSSRIGSRCRCATPPPCTASARPRRASRPLPGPSPGPANPETATYARTTRSRCSTATAPCSRAARTCAFRASRSRTRRMGAGWTASCWTCRSPRPVCRSWRLRAPSSAA